MYVDTSVLAAYYCPEPGSGQAQSILRAQRDLAVSTLTEVEFTSALARKVRDSGMSADDARRVLALFAEHLADRRYQRVAIEVGHFRMAREWIASFAWPLRTLDALHLAAAFITNRVLLTADRQLARCAEGLKVHCQYLEFAP